MKKFEYKIVSVRRKGMNSAVELDETEALLTGEGLVGWEIISSFDNVEESYYPAICFVMKREINQE